MRDFYEVLGVARIATRAEIRRAYRDRAKEAHPDGGGDAEEFAELALARDVLSDAARREVYDRVGRVEEKPIDDGDSVALQMLFGQFEFVVDMIEKRGLRIVEVDVIGDVRLGLAQKLEQVRTAVRRCEKDRDAALATAERCRAKKGKVDRVGPMFRAKAERIGSNLPQMEHERAQVERAIEILADHEFGAGGGKTAHRGPDSRMALPTFLNFGSFTT